MPINIVPKNDGMDEDEELDQFGGFGRQAVEEAAKRPTYASTQGQVGERERREAATAGPLKKPAVVTKEQMKKAGFDNLRDYLNSQKGLKRRDSKPVETPKTDTAKAPAKKEVPKIEAPKTEARKPGRSAAANRNMPKAESTSTPAKVASGATSVERMRNTMKQKFGEKNKYGMKKGGMVSSASKRADGIAKKGKTRGRMV
jgi:hypothetical protein